ERTFRRKKDAEELSCGFEVKEEKGKSRTKGYTMSRVEEELVGSLTCFLIKHSGEKQLCLAIMDKETVFNLKGMKKECLLLMDSPNYRFSMPTVLNLIVKR
ncbi:hypothetical protein, partial [Phocaeicola massiliensis]|uniref:hypothetical protein n=1 Tax=Phocaeicola massiliensis TaxID=204516 RepID=UPI001C88B0F8